MTQPPFIPETAPFTAEQRAWLNGFLAGLFAPGLNGQAPSPPSATASAPGAPLLILFGSQTGTAEGLARRLARESEQRGFAPRVLALNDCEQAALAETKRLILITSTWGDGDPPDNAVNFWAWLSSETAQRLEQLEFAVLGLGDRNYSDFCGASKKFDSRLEALGARRLAPRGECDVDYESTAKTWAEALWNKLVPQGGEPAPVPLSTNGTSNGSHPAHRPEAGRPGKANPFPAKLLKNVLLNKPGSAKEVRHFEISLAGSGLTYQVGDALGVQPSNCPTLVEGILAALRCAGDEPAQLGEVPTPLRQALLRHFELTRPTQELLSAVAERVPNGELASLLGPARADDLKAWLRGRDVLDILGCLEAPLPIPSFVAALRRLAPRLYSISSSPSAHPGEVHLTVSAVRYQHLGRGRVGVASTYLADRVDQANPVKVFVQASPGFRLPADGDAPMIMVGPGTGIAPFRAFLEERQAVGARGKNWLFFGDQCHATDFLYEEQLTGWQKSGHLARLDLAFSRDQPQKLYVQDRMREQAAELWSWLDAGAHFYVCGDASRMAKDVDQTLHQIGETAGGLSPDDAKAFVARLKSEKRYQRDVY